MRWQLALVALLCVGCRDQTHGQRPSASFSASSSALQAAAAASDTAAPTAQDCDAQALWFGSTLPVDGRADAFINTLRGWTPECRRKAFEGMCSSGCSEVVTDKVIAASTSAERSDLLMIRMTRNRRAAAIGRDLYSKVNAIAKYAKSIRGTPRGSAYHKPNASDYEYAAELVDGNPCLDRMRKDFTRIKDLSNELKAQLSSAPSGTVALTSALSFIRGCVDCSDDRSSCDLATEPLENVKENLAEVDKLIAADQRAITAISKQPH